MTNTDPSIFSSAMRRACDEARLWLGSTSPNPPVGAVGLDNKGNILAVAAHHRAGEDHAEAALLKVCDAQNMMSQLHTMCVTLEPCTHFGRTPPCADAIIKAGIRRVVIGVRDPNPHVTGGGYDRLRQAGIDVIDNVETEMCRRLIHAFAFHAQSGKPFVTVKRAFNVQGSMIPPAGDKTFTSEKSLVLAHLLRKKADAIVTGSGTIIADNPFFNVRHVADYAHKRRILAILDRRQRISIEYRMQASERGLDVRVYADIDQCFSDLEKRGIRDILVESGPNLSDSILESNHWTMKVDIHKNERDRVNVAFNANNTIPFDSKNLAINSLLPL